MRILSFLVVVSSLGCTAAPPTPQANPTAEERPPNIVVIFADDLGYGDLGAYGHPTIQTPNLDRMAAEGQKWTQFYVGASVCSPSRAALLTGRLPVRNGMYGTMGRTRVFFHDSPNGMPQEELTLAEVLKEQGYATAVFGKWHLGHLPDYLPAQQGFDEYFGIPYSNDMDATRGYDINSRTSRGALFDEPEIDSWHVPVFEGTEIVERPAEQTTITKRYTERAVDFIERHRDEPFYLYLPHTMPHVPLFRADAFVGESAAGIYGDVIEEIDWSVGQVLGKLRELRLAENTLVVFTSDNGPWLVFETHGGSAGLLNQGKGTTWDGGMRVPALFWWPGRIEPATVMELGTTMDVFATAVGLGGGALPEGHTIDGLDLSPVLFEGGASPRETVAYYRYDELYAVRKGWYKAHFITQGEYGMGPDKTLHDPPLLYHLGIDPGERFDIAAEHPDIVAELIAEADRYRETVPVAPSLFDARPPAE